METVELSPEMQPPHFYPHAREGVCLVRGSGCVLAVMIERIFCSVYCTFLITHYNIEH
jgi:hypothetical protein